MYDKSYQLNSPSCIAEAVEDDLIVINLLSGKYYNLRGAAAQAWRAMMSGVTPQQLLDANNWTEPQTQAFDQFLQLLVTESLMTAHGQINSSALAVTILLADHAATFEVDVFTDMEEMLRLDPIHDADTNIGWPNKP